MKKPRINTEVEYEASVYSLSGVPRLSTKAAAFFSCGS